MATVVFQNDNIRVKVPVGMSMREAARKSGASIPFGCRIGDCTTCTARIETGMLYLSDKTKKEMSALEMLGGNVGELRLMCQCHVRCEEGEIVILQYAG
jgi:ferredoxin